MPTQGKKLPEASPKGPGSKHFRALAGHCSRITKRTLATQGLASRTPLPEQKTPQPEKNTSEIQQITPLPPNYNILKFLTPDTSKSPNRPLQEKGGGPGTLQTTGSCYVRPDEAQKHATSGVTLYYIITNTRNNNSHDSRIGTPFHSIHPTHHEVNHPDIILP